MPALVNSKVGSFPGTSELEGTTACPCSRKNSRKARRTSAALMYEGLFKVISPDRNRRRGPSGYDPMKSPDTAKSALAAPSPASWAVPARRISGHAPHEPKGANPDPSQALPRSHRQEALAPSDLLRCATGPGPDQHG